MPMAIDRPERLPEPDRQWSAWMAAAQGGDRGAYEALLRACVPHVRRVARAVGVGAESLDDVVQDTLLTIHRARHTYEAGRSFTAWLNAIARRRAIDSLRGRMRIGAREVHSPLAYEEHADEGPTPEQAHDADEAALRLRREVARLAPGQREAVEALALREQTLQETAAETGRTKVSLKVNLHRALKRLRERLDQGQLEQDR